MRRTSPSQAFSICPANPSERCPKIAHTADVVNLDLEFAVSRDSRDDTRDALRSADLKPETTIFRLKRVGTDDHPSNFETLRRTGPRMVMFAKTSLTDDQRGHAPFEPLGLCEAPFGVHVASQIAASAHMIALMGRSQRMVVARSGHPSCTAEGSLRELARHARAKALIDARVNGLGPLTTTYLDFGKLLARGRGCHLRPRGVVMHSSFASCGPSRCVSTHGGSSGTRQEDGDGCRHSRRRLLIGRRRG